MSNKKECSNCIYYATGDCMRYPPSERPVYVKEYNWCGEYKGIEKEINNNTLKLFKRNDLREILNNIIKHTDCPDKNGNITLNLSKLEGFFKQYLNCL